MFLFAIIFSIFLLTFLNYQIIRNKFVANIENYSVNCYNLPSHYGLLSAFWFLVIALTVLVYLILNVKAISFVENFISENYFIALAIFITFVLYSLFSFIILNDYFKPRLELEKIAKFFIVSATIFSIVITCMIVVSIFFEAIKFFKQIPFFNFLFGLEWNPQNFSADYIEESKNSFGAIPIFAGTLLITLVAMLVAIPIGLFSAIYLAEYASKNIRKYLKPAIEMLAGIPTVVYGYFAAFVIAPFIRDLGISLGLSVELESALAAGFVMGIMIIPFILSLSDDVINAVPNSMRDASYALGSTKSETIRKVVIPCALPGIMGAVLLAISRAVGETMIVAMAAGLVANLSFNPLDSVTTATVQIVTLLVGDQEFGSAKTLSAFALGLVLFFITLTLNIIALLIVKKYKEKYE